MRFWQENGSADPTDPNRWRARINYVNSRQKFHVVGLERAFGLVRAMLVDENGLLLEKYPGGRIHNIRVSPEAATSAQLGSSIWRFWRCLFSLSPTAASFDARRFHVGHAAARERLQRIGEVFIAGFNRALRADAPVERCEYLDTLDPDLRGFAAEGVAMGCAIGDAVMLGGHRLRGWVDAADEFSYLTHVGAGWALARVPWRRCAILDCLDPVHRWLAFDGLGFHDACFYSRRIASGWRRLQAGYAARTYDQGVGARSGSSPAEAPSVQSS